jgi:uncharacterized protein YjbJ (UPF0337 family)
LKVKIQQHWDKLTDGQLEGIEGRREELAGKLQEAYAISKAEAEKQISECYQCRNSCLFHTS